MRPVSASVSSAEPTFTTTRRAPARGEEDGVRGMVMGKLYAKLAAANLRKQIGEQRLRAGSRTVVREPGRRGIIPCPHGRRGLGAGRDRVSRRRGRGDRSRDLA